MRPDQYDGIFNAVRDGLKGMRHPWLNLVLPISTSPDPLGHRPSLYSRDFALKNLKSLRLIEM